MTDIKELKEKLVKLASIVEVMKSEHEKVASDNEELRRRLELLEHEKMALEAELERYKSLIGGNSVPAGNPIFGANPVVGAPNYGATKTASEDPITEQLVKVALEY